MIDFDIDKAQATRNRFGDLITSLDKQYDSVRYAYLSLKGQLKNKLKTVTDNIECAKNDKSHAESVIAHNKEVEQRTRRQIQELKDDIERFESEKRQLENDISKAEQKISTLSAMQARLEGENSNITNAISQLQTKISRMTSDVRSKETDISGKRRVIEVLERKLAAIDRANKQLEQIIKSIESSLKHLRMVERQIKTILPQMESCYEKYDGKHNMARKGMEWVCERTDNAIKFGNDALYQFQQVGCYSKEIKVDSPQTIFNVSEKINDSAHRMSFATSDLKRGLDRYKSYLSDNVTKDVGEKTNKINNECTGWGREMEHKANCLSNAAYALKMYLDCAV